MLMGLSQSDFKQNDNAALERLILVLLPNPTRKKGQGSGVISKILIKVRSVLCWDVMIFMQTQKQTLHSVHDVFQPLRVMI